jgi:hypothetical protein
MQKVDVLSLEQFSLKDLSEEDKVILLKELGFETDGIYVMKDGELISDKYLGVPVKINKMLIFPGSTIVLDDNELSVAMYIQEYGDEDVI